MRAGAYPEIGRRIKLQTLNSRSRYSEWFAKPAAFASMNKI